MVLAALVACTVSVPRYMSSYGQSAQGRVLYAQNIGYAHAPSLGYSRPSNIGYAHDAATNLAYTYAPHMGYTHGSERHGYDTADNYVSNKKLNNLASCTNTFT